MQRWHSCYHQRMARWLPGSCKVRRNTREAAASAAADARMYMMLVLGPFNCCSGQRIVCVLCADVQATTAAFVGAITGMQQYLQDFANAPPRSKRQQLEQVMPGLIPGVTQTCGISLLKSIIPWACHPLSMPSSFTHHALGSVSLAKCNKEGVRGVTGNRSNNN